VLAQNNRAGPQLPKAPTAPDDCVPAINVRADVVTPYKFVAQSRSADTGFDKLSAAAVYRPDATLNPHWRPRGVATLKSDF